MGYNKYVGNRYVPKQCGDWDNTKNTQYESLSVVQYGGASYTSKQNVPKGIDILNPLYWVLSANYNAQVEVYRQDVINYGNTVNSYSNTINTINEQSQTTIERLKDIHINVKDWGAIGNSFYVDWSNMNDIKYYTNDTKNVISNDDTVSIDEAIAKSIENGCRRVYLPEGEYLYKGKALIVDGFVIEGNRAILHVPEGVILKKGNDLDYIVSNVTLVGESKQGSIGLTYAMETTGSTCRDMNHVDIFNYDIDIEFLSNSYLINVYNCKLSNCNTAILYKQGITNSGENINFHNCVISSNNICVDHEDFGDIKFFNCSFDYFKGYCVKVTNRSRSYLIDCHIETDYTNTVPFFYITGSGSLVHLKEGTMILNQRNASSPSIPNIAQIFDVVGDTCGLYIDGTNMDDIVLANKYLVSGNGYVKVKNTKHYQYSKTFKMVSEYKKNNLICNNYLTSAWIDNKPLDLTFITPRSSTNWNTNSDMTIEKATTGGYFIQKFSALNTQNTFNIAVPVSPQNRYNSIISLYNQANTGMSGNIDIKVKYVKLINSESYNPFILQETVISSQTIDITKYTAPTSIDCNASDYYIECSPFWATHFVICLDFTNVGVGNMFVTNAVVNEF